MTRRRPLVAAALAAIAVVGNVQAHAAGPHTLDWPVVAIVGEFGFNVLATDFQTPGGVTPSYPAALGPVTAVALPTLGSFSERVAAVRRGALGHLQPGRLYGIRGTRLLVAAAPGTVPRQDVTGGGTVGVTVGGSSDPMVHGTGVADAAIGTRFGTAPDALGLLVLGDHVDAWDWIGAQRGIDIVSMSTHEPTGRATGCAAAEDVRAFHARGGMVFSSSGNTTDQTEPLSPPHGLPEVYQVGGVHDDGAPWGVPPSADSEPFYAVGQVTRPYVTGELYSFTTAGYDGTTTTMRFGGTSGATPRTAGRAASLLRTARTILSEGTPKRGPLADGRVTGAEVERLLRQVAIPYYAAQHPAAFAAEGYGYLNGAAQVRAESILRGASGAPDRASDDQMESVVEQARAAAFTGC